MNKNKATIWQLIGFGLNNSASNAHWFYILIFFLVYCTDYLKLSPVIIGLMMTAFRIFDGITDPIIGFIIDKTDTRFGKFRPFMLLGTLIMNLSFLAIFWGVKFDTNLKNYIYITIFYSIWVIGYTCVTICTKGAQAVLTNDSAQRSLLSGIDTVARILLDFIFVASGSIILNYFGGISSTTSFRKFAFVTVIITTICSMSAILGIWKKDNKEHYASTTFTEVKITDYFDIFKTNSALKTLVLAASSSKIAFTIVSTVTFYFFTLVIAVPNAQLKVNGPTFLVGILASFVAISLAVKFGRKKAYILGMCFTLISITVTLLLKPFTPDKIMLLVICCAFINFGKNATETHTIPMIADVVDYERYTNKRFVPGMISTIFSFFDKLISSLAGLLVGIVLQLANYTPGMEITPVLYNAIIFLYFGVPLIGYVIGLVGMKFYPISSEMYKKMNAIQE